MPAINTALATPALIPTIPASQCFQDQIINREEFQLISGRGEKNLKVKRSKAHP